MHEAVTSPSTISPSCSNLDDLQTPISRRPHFHSADNLGWSQANDDGAEYSPDDWSTSNESLPSHLKSGRRVNQVGFQKMTFTANLASRNDANSSERSQGVGQWWRFNANGQLVDPDSSNWDLTDEIVRLKINEVSRDGDAVHPQLRTPAKTKFVAASVAQINEASPLETASSASIGSSPHASENEIIVSHSRGSSTDTTISSSRESVGSVPLLLAKPPLKVNTGTDVKERPHSFSGGLSTADLRRLQQTGETPALTDTLAHGQYRDNLVSSVESLAYPSIVNSTIHRPQPHPHPQMFDYRSYSSQINQAADRDEMQVSQGHQRNLSSISQGQTLRGQPLGSMFIPGEPMDNSQPSGYRQPSRGYSQQNVAANPSTMGYVSHLSTNQQVYDMMPPGTHHEHPAVARVQQQHNVFRPTHHHSASDSAISARDAVALALLNSNVTPFTTGMFQAGPLPLYQNQYFNTQEQYPIGDPSIAVSRLQVQYPNQYSVLSPSSVMNSESIVSLTNNGPGPSANNRKLGLYKTELCRSWEEKGSCRYGSKCQFAHGEEELRKVARHPKYKTEICRTFWVSGTCPYGKRCCFIHTELPAGGPPAPGGSSTPGTENSTQTSDGRARSLSTNSDPNDASVSLLARINVKRNHEPTSSTTPTDGSSFQFTRPPTGSLRVDTSTLDTSVKQNKSAYPSFASNGILLPAPEHSSQKLPGPVTAGPDLGRHNNVRREIVGYNQRTHKTNTSSSSLRDIDIRGSPPVSSFVLSSGDGNVKSSGHSRTGSAGNWGHAARSNKFSYGGTTSASEISASSPWHSAELGITSRMNEKVWA